MSTVISPRPDCPESGEPSAEQRSGFFDSARRRAGRSYRRHAGPAQSNGARRRRLPGAHGTGGANAGSHAWGCERVLPRQRLAAGAHTAASGPRRPLRVRLSDSAQGGSEIAGRTVRGRNRLHRPACLGRSVFARRRLDRARSDLGPAGRRGPHSAGVHGDTRQCGAGHRFERLRRVGFQCGHARCAHAGRPARHLALFARPVDRDHGPGRAGRRGAGKNGCAAHAGRRAHVRVGGRHGRPRVDYRRAVPQKTRTR